MGNTTVDYLIVGGGPAGSVLANRLSVDPHSQVLLLEAGPDFGPGQAGWPVPLLDASAIPDNGDGWGYSCPGPTGANHVAVPRSRNLGGSTSMNGCIWIRGSAADYDAWAAAGNDGWSYAELLPHFIASESDSIGGPGHGSCGEVPVERAEVANRSRFECAFVDACHANGLQPVEDINGDPFQSPGVGSTPRNTHANVRMNAALTWIDPVRHRQNLRIEPDVLIDRVLFDGTRATGVIAADGRSFSGREVLLCSGAYGSPAILMRSGIGPVSQLNSLGIPALADVPGVGENLLDHPKIDGCLVAAIAPGYEPPETAFMQLMVTARSSQCDDEIDLHIYQGQSRDAETGRWQTWATVSLQQAFSTGRMQLRSRDPNEPPLIDHSWLSDPADLAAICDGVELLRTIMSSPPVDELAEPDPANTLQWTDRAELEAQVLQKVGTTFHPSGTCKMGPNSDDLAVVDNECRVRGVQGLRVIDASIFPTIPRGNLHAPIVAAASLMAERIIADRQSS